MIRVYGGAVYIAVAAYAAVVDRLVLPIRRQQELEADRIAASAAGPENLAGALRSVTALATLWAQFEREFVEPYRKAAGVVPDEPYHAFAGMLDDPECRTRIDELRRHATGRPTSPGDPHPPLGERVRRLGEMPAAVGSHRHWGAAVVFDIDESLFTQLADLLDQGPAMWRRFPDWMGAYDQRSLPTGDDQRLWRDDDAGAIAIRQSMTMGRGRPTAERRPWRDWLAELAEYRATLPLIALARAVREVTAARGDGAAPTAPSLKTVLDVLDAYRAMDLARALDPRPTRTTEHDWHARMLLTVAVHHLIGHALVARGSACWVMGWTGPSRLAAGDADSANVSNWVSTAIEDPGQVAWLRMQIHSIHVDEAAVVIPEEHRTGRRPAPPHAESGPDPAPQARTVRISPAAPTRARGQRRLLTFTSLAVLLGLVALGGLAYVAQDDPPRPYQPGPMVSPAGDPRLPPAPQGSLLPPSAGVARSVTG